MSNNSESKVIESLSRCVEARRAFGLSSTRSVARRRMLMALLVFACAVVAGCRHDNENAEGVRPRFLRDVPAQRLAFTFEADAGAPQNLANENPNDLLPSVQRDFEQRRAEDALVRTVVAPDGQRALAIYETAEMPRGEFRIDMYSADGNFLRNLTPPDLSGAFAPMAAWSPDGSFIAFIGRKNLTPKPSPTPPEELPQLPEAAPQPTASVAPNFAPVPVFDTEQIYVCNRDGFDLKPLTSRNGLIYFSLAWAPDNHAIAALACKEAEWDAREKEFKLPAGRPRLVSLDGRERLLDDESTDALPVWCPDASKVATAFGTEVAIYDAAGKSPTSARIA